MAGFSACIGRTGANNATHTIWRQMSNRAAAVRMSAFYRRKRAVKSKHSNNQNLDLSVRLDLRPRSCYEMDDVRQDRHVGSACHRAFCRAGPAFGGFVHPLECA